MKNTIEILERMNVWRRYDGLMLDGPEQPCPKEFGLAIDDAVRKLKEYERLMTAKSNAPIKPSDWYYGLSESDKMKACDCAANNDAWDKGMRSIFWFGLNITKQQFMWVKKNIV